MASDAVQPDQHFAGRTPRSAIRRERIAERTSRKPNQWTWPDNDDWCVEQQGLHDQERLAPLFDTVDARQDNHATLEEVRACYRSRRTSK